MEPSTPAPKTRSALNQLPKNTPNPAPTNNHAPRSLALDDANKQSKYWCVTVNNYTAQFAALPTGCTYLVSGEEKGEAGTPHLQCYVELSRHQRRAYVAKLFPSAHLQPRYANATSEQAANYCKKDGKFVEFGTISKAPERGKRTDLVEIANLAKTGATLQQIYESNPSTYMRNYRAIQHVRQITHTPLAYRPNLQVRLYIGATRTGKSYHARVTEDCFAKPVGKGLWFDGYDRHKKVVIDEFRGQYALSDFLQITDPFKVQVEIKGGHTWFEPDLIIVTTNDHPTTMYLDHAPETREAFFARFQEVWWWYSPRKYLILTPEQRTKFFQEQKYPSVPIDAPMVVRTPFLEDKRPAKKPKLNRQNATISEATVPPPYTYDHPTKSIKRAAKSARIDTFLSVVSEDEEDNYFSDSDMQKAYDEAHRRPEMLDAESISSDDEATQPILIDEEEYAEGTDSSGEESDSLYDSELSD